MGIGFRSAALWARALLACFAMVLAPPVHAAGAVGEMPAEYSDVMAIVNRLASANDLGDRELAFTIVVGEYGAWRAGELGLCRDERCGFFHSLNPFVRHRGDVGEIVRQAYLFGDINAQASTNGTIEIPRVAFRLYGHRTGYLACTIAHEIVHARDAHVFAHTEALSQHPEATVDAARTRLGNTLSQEFELLADSKAWEMTVRAGYPLEMCKEELLFSHLSSGDGRVTSPDASHPGVRDRIEKLAAYIAEHRGSLQPEPATRGDWLYDSELNVLRFIPRPRPEGGGV